MKSLLKMLSISASIFLGNAAFAQIGINTSTPKAKLEIKGNSAAPSTSGSSDNGVLRLSESANSASKVLDIGTNGTTYGWIQPRLNSDYSTNYNILLNPNGGNVSIGTGANTATLNVGGAISATGTIRSSAAGQILNSVMFNETDLSISASGSAIANTNTTIIQTNYTPVSSSSKIFIEFHCKFDVAGSTNDNWKTYIIVGSTTLQTREAVWSQSDGAGGRGASLFPISAVYSNTTGNAITIKINVHEISGDDTFTLYPDAILSITEVAQ